MDLSCLTNVNESDGWHDEPTRYLSSFAYRGLAQAITAINSRGSYEIDWLRPAGGMNSSLFRRMPLHASAVGSDQPRRIDMSRMPKQSAAPPIIVGAAGGS